MNINTGYKLIAVVSLCYATYSCSSSAHSHTDPEILQKLDALQATVDALTTDVDQVQVAVRSAPAGQQACTVEEVVSGNTTGCDTAKLPDGVSASTSYCINQGRAGHLSAAYKLEPHFELELGGGWPNAIWGKLTNKTKMPPIVPIGPIPVPLPSEISAGGGVSLGRGLGICVQIPLVSMDAAMTAQVHDLVRGVNDGGKYNRRTGRVLDYAAVRTPIAQPTLFSGAAVQTTAMGQSKAMFQDTDDAFDIADAAMERLIDGDFLQAQNGLMLFKDPVFQDLISSLEVPVPALDTINDPDRLLGIFKTIGQANIAATCQTMGITAESRDRFPALANQCARFGIYPNIGRSLAAADRLTNVQSSLSSLRTWMCSNISLGLFSGC